MDDGVVLAICLLICITIISVIAILHYGPTPMIINPDLSLDDLERIYAMCADAYPDYQVDNCIDQNTLIEEQQQP